MGKWLFFWKTVGACTLAAMLFGIVHDQITIRICPEYFTVWHPQIFDTDNLTVLAVCWGIFASWWIGALLGVLLGASALLGPRPVPNFRIILHSIKIVLMTCAAAAIVAGLIEWHFKFPVPIFVMGYDIDHMSYDVQIRFLVDLYIHNGSIDTAPFAAILCAWLIFRHRKTLADASSH
jgi:hypothetical protein